MTTSRFVAFAAALPLAAALTFTANDAEACGGCFVPPEEATQVTGHNMILSVGMTQQTLYDQIEYVGSPEEFAWVLPIKGTVEVGLSSDLLFQLLDESTGVVVNPPPLNCGPQSCGDFANGGAVTGTSASGGGPDDGGVTVLDQATVGPYETVQLQASDPDALYAWMDQHGYNVPEEIAPIIDDYIANEFNFLAMRLVPGVGVDRMAPVRITSQGAGASLPQKSNYSDLRQQGYDASNGFAWLVEQTGPVNADQFTNYVVNFNDIYPDIGYETEQEAEEDLHTLFAGMNANSVVVTRLRAELSREALAADLVVGASDDQSQIDGWFQVTKAVGSDPCPPPVVCDDDGGTGSSGSGGLGNGNSGSRDRDGGGCAMAMDRGSAASAVGGLGLFALALLGFAARRKQNAPKKRR